MIVMTPRPPSTVMWLPLGMRRVASPVATTAGIPYSRAMREACAAAAPRSVTTVGIRRDPLTDQMTCPHRGRRAD